MLKQLITAGLLAVSLNSATTEQRVLCEVFISDLNTAFEGYNKARYKQDVSLRNAYENIIRDLIKTMNDCVRKHDE